MTTNHHTPIPTGAAGNASSFNAPMGQLDSKITDTLNGGPFSGFSTANPETNQISFGAINVVTNLFVKLQAESGSTDTLDSINTSTNYSILYLKAYSGHTITLSEYGNITSGTPIVLSGEKVAVLLYENPNWTVINVLGNNEFSPGYIVGLEINNTSSNTNIAISEGRCLDDTHTVIISLNVSAISISTSGIGGLDTGSVAADTWYYVYAVKGDSGSGAIFSTSASSPTLPAGYNSYKRLIGIVRTDGSSNIHRQIMYSGGGQERTVIWQEDCTASPFQVANAINVATDPAWTTIDLSAVVPPIAHAAIVSVYTAATGNGDILYRRNSSDGRHWLHRSSSSIILAQGNIKLPVTTTQTLDITGGANDEDLSMYVNGYVFTLTPDL